MHERKGQANGATQWKHQNLLHTMHWKCFFSCGGLERKKVHAMRKKGINLCCPTRRMRTKVVGNSQEKTSNSNAINFQYAPGQRVAVTCGWGQLPTHRPRVTPLHHGIFSAYFLCSFRSFRWCGWLWGEHRLRPAKVASGLVQCEWKW